MSEKRPQELSIGDVFTVPVGPHAGRVVEVVSAPQSTRYGNYMVAVRLLNPVAVTLDYKVEITVEEAPDAA